MLRFMKGSKRFFVIKIVAKVHKADAEPRKYAYLLYKRSVLRCQKAKITYIQPNYHEAEEVTFVYAARKFSDKNYMQLVIGDEFIHIELNDLILEHPELKVGEPAT